MHFAVLALLGLAYLWLLGAAVVVWLLPRRLILLWPVASPLVGWSVLVAIGYPLNAVVPFRYVAWGAAVAALFASAVAWRHPAVRTLTRRREPWLEALPPMVIGAAVYAAAAAPHLTRGTQTGLVADSDTEHFADVVASLLNFPIGLGVAAHQGLEATPIGLAYHYLQASLSALSGADTYATALPSHYLMLWLAVFGVYAFGRMALRLTAGWAAVATALFALGSLPFGVAAFGWGQQTAAVATVPFALLLARQALVGRSPRAAIGAGLSLALAGGSLYLATVPFLAAGTALMVIAGLALSLAGRRPRCHSWPVGLLRTSGVMVLVVLLAGLYSHLSAAAFLWERVGAGLLRVDDQVGRSTHVDQFAGLLAMLGLEPIDLFRDVDGLDGEAILRWRFPGGAVLPGVASMLLLSLLAAGLARDLAAMHRRLPIALPYLLAWGAFEIYLRVWRPFPYGEFKLLSTVWFLAPCLAVSGAAWLVRLTPGARQWGGPARLATGVMFVALLAISLALTGVRVHVGRLVALPWGAALPDAELDQIRLMVGHVPPGASVYVSPVLAPPSAHLPGLLTTHRAGFTSRWAQADYLAKRWRGAATALLAFSGRPVYGTLQRHSAELRAPVSPLDAGFALLDTSDDPRLYGLSVNDLVFAGSTLSLYRVPPADLVEHVWLGPLNGVLPVRVSLRGLDLTADGVALTVFTGPGGTPSTYSAPARLGALPESYLPIGESLPGRNAPLRPRPIPSPALLRETPSATSPVAPSGPGQRGASVSRNVTVGLQAISEARVVVTVAITGVIGAASGPEIRREVLVGPGLTWYTSPPVQGLATVSLVVALQPVSASGAPVPAADAGGGLRGVFPDVSVVAVTVRSTGDSAQAAASGSASAAGRTSGPAAGVAGTSSNQGAAGVAGTSSNQGAAGVAGTSSNQGAAGVAGTSSGRGPGSVAGSNPGGQAQVEALDRSPAGTRWPLLLLDANASSTRRELGLTAWYSYLGADQEDVRLQLREAGRLWTPGIAVDTTLHPGPGTRIWTARLAPGELPAQQVSDGRPPLSTPRPWGSDPGERWLWLEAGPDQQPAAHQPYWLSYRLDPGRLTLHPDAESHLVLPLLARERQLPRLEEGTLVKGRSDGLFLVSEGRLRWVPDLDVLARRGIPWRLTAVDDFELWSYPVGLPLD